NGCVLSLIVQRVPTPSLRSGERVAFAQRRPGEHLCWKSSMFWRLRLPHSILADQGVCEDDEFSGDGDESDLGRLSAGCETLIEGLQVGVEARRRECGQIQDTPDAGTTAPNDAHAVAEAGLIGDRSEACEHTALLGADAAELGEAGDQGRRGDEAEARDRG